MYYEILQEDNVKILIYTDNYERQLRQTKIIDDINVHNMRILHDYEDILYEMVIFIYNSDFKELIIEQLIQFKNCHKMVIFLDEIDIDVAELSDSCTIAANITEIVEILRIIIIPIFHPGPLASSDIYDIDYILKQIKFYKYTKDNDILKDVDQFYFCLEGNSSKEYLKSIIDKNKEYIFNRCYAHIYNANLKELISHYIYSVDCNYDVLFKVWNKKKISVYEIQTEYGLSFSEALKVKRAYTLYHK